jgi:hypothetical protein
MTLDEAIKYMEQGIKHQGHRQIIIPIEAAQLGIEALKRIRNWRNSTKKGGKTLLPGETKE